LNGRKSRGADHPPLTHDMNGHHDHEHVNGHQPNGVQMNEAELDAYEAELTTEAVIDQVKVTASYPANEIHRSRVSSPNRRDELHYTVNLKSDILLSRSSTNGRAFRQHIVGEKSDSEIAAVISSATVSFSQISQRINRCESALNDDLNREDLGAMIRRIQGYEKIKFEAVPTMTSHES